MLISGVTGCGKPQHCYTRRDCDKLCDVMRETGEIRHCIHGVKQADQTVSSEQALDVLAPAFIHIPLFRGEQSA